MFMRGLPCDLELKKETVVSTLLSLSLDKKVVKWV